MIRSRLRLYSEPNGETGVTVLSRAQHGPRVCVSASEVFEALSDAMAHDRTWLNDFNDDEMMISNDLYEVIRAYQNFRRPSA